jgi:hypothetical protein
MCEGPVGLGFFPERDSLPKGLIGGAKVVAPGSVSWPGRPHPLPVLQPRLHALILCMKNFWGQEIHIGSTVGVGYRRTGATWHQVGVVVTLEEKLLPYYNPDSKTYWATRVVWISEDRGGCNWYDGPVFESSWNAEDLLLLANESLDPGLQESLRKAWSDWQVKHTTQADWVLA